MNIRTANDPEYRRLMVLRDDAMSRGMYELALAYGQMLTRLGIEMIEQNNIVLRQKTC